MENLEILENLSEFIERYNGKEIGFSKKTLRRQSQRKQLANKK